MTTPTQFSTPERTSTFRRMAANMWRKPSDPSIYGFVDIDVTRTLEVIDRVRAGGVKLTMTHVVSRAIAKAFAENPELNAKVGLGGSIRQRDRVDVFVSVATGNDARKGAKRRGGDLTGVRIDGADTLPLEEIAAATAQKVDATRKDEDPTYKRSRALIGKLPGALLRPMLWLTDVLTNDLELHLPGASMPRDPFGTVVVTNVGMFGIDTAFAPMVPLSRAPMLLLVTEVRERPWVVRDGDGPSRLEPRSVLRLCATFDHRIVDGAAAGRLARSLVRWVQDPLAGRVADAATGPAGAAAADDADNSDAADAAVRAA